MEGYESLSNREKRGEEKGEERRGKKREENWEEKGEETEERREKKSWRKRGEEILTFITNHSHHNSIDSFINIAHGI